MEPTILQPLCHPMVTAVWQGRSYYPIFTDEEFEAQEGEAICCRSHRWQRGFPPIPQSPRCSYEGTPASCVVMCMSASCLDHKVFEGGNHINPSMLTLCHSLHKRCQRAQHKSPPSHLLVQDPLIPLGPL